MKDIEQLFILVKSIEEKYPVQNWKINNIDVWPIIRVQLRDLALKSNTPKRTTSSESKSSLPKNILNKGKVFFSAFTAFTSLFCSSKKEFFFLGYTAHLQDINKVWYNRFYEYFLDNLKSRDAVLLEVKKAEYYKPRYNKEYICEISDLVYIYRLLFRKLSTANQSRELPHYENVLNEISAFYPNAYSHISSNIFYYIDELTGLIQLFKAVLKRNRPKAVFVLSYYSFEATALVVAANQLGIPSVDMQHGMQGNYHIAYGTFNLRSHKGYNTLPKAFWNWNEGDAASIRNWAKGSIHSSFCGGNTWLSFWNNHETFRSFFQSELKQSRNNVLISLQPSFDYKNESIYKLIKKTNIDGTWYIRVHPRQLDFLPEIKTFYTNIGNKLGKSVVVSKATALPLPLLLQISLYHITFHSSVAIEAASYGVPTFFLLENAQEIYKGVIPEELMTSINHNGSELFEQFERLYKQQLLKEYNSLCEVECKTVDDLIDYLKDS